MRTTTESNNANYTNYENHAQLTGIILAGGAGKRLGYKNKALLKIGNLTVIERVICAVSKISQKVILITNSPDGLKHLNLPTYADIFPGAGPLGGIYTGLKVSETYQNVIVACDMPFIQAKFLKFLANQSDGCDFVIPLTYDGYHPLCAIYSRRCIKPIEALLKTGNLKITNLLPCVDSKIIDLKLSNPDHDPNVLFNINTHKDYLEAVRIADRYNRKWV